MGNICAPSSVNNETSGVIDRQLKTDFKAEQQNVKLLLLGAAGGGKSTLLRQMQILHTNNFEPVDERLKYTANVHANVIIALERLLKGAERLISRWELTETEEAVAMLQDLLKNQQYVDPLECAEFNAALKVFWTDPAVHEQLMPNGNQFQMLESTAHLFNNVDRITAPDYVPTVQDILMMRVPTTGITEVTFTVNRFPFKVFDVGGQRTERRKWIHCFDNVNAIIFVAALSEFDEILEEDHNTNRLFESMRLFQSICRSKWFMATGIILFLNKKDLFEQKIRTKTIRTIFKNYSGPDTYLEQANYVEHKFESLNPNPHKRIYAHQTCATDTDQMELVLKNVFELILMSMFKKTSIY